MGNEREPSLAHTAEDGRVHLLEDHLRGVAGLASAAAQRWGAGDLGHLAGLWHDLGKYSADFQRYIRQGHGENAHLEDDPSRPTARMTRGSVDHSSAGALHAKALNDPALIPLHFAIAGHHGGLANHQALQERLVRKKDHLAAALAGAPPADLLTSRSLARPQLGSAKEVRRLELATRMLFSALVDADFLDTEAFFDEQKPKLRGSTATIAELRARLTRYLDEKQASMSREARSAPEVLRVRAEVREACALAAKGPRSVFTLTVPTGGGKTFASLELGLRHAEEHGLERVIVAIPFTSIVEQTTLAYRQALGLTDDDEDGILVEHHAAFDPDRETARNRLASENWNARIVVTTTVQLFESLFARRVSTCRKLHRIARSVIVLDEAQTLPRGLLAQTVEVLEGLVRDYGSTLVISTATQPALGQESLAGAPRTTLKDEPAGFTSMVEIVPPSLRAFERLRRVRVRWPDTQVPTPYLALAEEVSREDDVLVIVHKRADARELATHLDAILEQTDTVHLSALMHAWHRAKVLATVRERKNAGHPVRLVATQLVEAGVDLDFRVVYRALGGMDAMAQAAGRCNREGRLRELGELRVFLAETKPPVGISRQALETSVLMLRANPSLDLFAPKVASEYFKRLYTSGNLDEKDLASARSKLQFEDVADRYRIIEDDWSETVVIPMDDATKLLAELRFGGPSRRVLRGLGRYSVSVEKRAVAGWLATGHAEKIRDSVIALTSARGYDERFGLVPEQVTTFTSQDLVQ